MLVLTSLNEDSSKIVGLTLAPAKIPVTYVLTVAAYRFSSIFTPLVLISVNKQLKLLIGSNL